MIARLAARLEQGLDRLRPAPRGRPVILTYPGWAGPGGLVLPGRVLAGAPGAGVAGAFRTRELAGVRVRAAACGAVAVTDEEGFFALTLPRGTATGWVPVNVSAPGAVAVTGRVLVPAPGARWGVISDIDDTVLMTGAWSLPRNLWTTLTGTVDSRQVFPDAVALFAALAQGGVNPVYWVSSSPWNLQGFLAEVMARAGLPAGPMFLRDWGLTERHLVASPHRSHKGAAIDLLMVANPGLPYVLVGDTGQKDAQVYAEAVARHPGRVLRVILRQAGGREVATEALRAAGVPVDVVADYRAVAAALDAMHAGRD
jgi:phosphatidate phosphatase APP1